MDVEILARIQFAFTIAFHYIYPPLSIGLGLIMVIMEGQCEIILRQRNHQYAFIFLYIFYRSSKYRGESGIGLLSESLINNKICTIGENHWIAEEPTFYDKPLEYSVRALTVVRLLVCPSQKMISEIPVTIRESLKNELDKGNFFAFYIREKKSFIFL